MQAKHAMWHWWAYKALPYMAQAEFPPDHGFIVCEAVLCFTKDDARRMLPAVKRCPSTTMSLCQNMMEFFDMAPWIEPGIDTLEYLLEYIREQGLYESHGWAGLKLPQTTRVTAGDVARMQAERQANLPPEHRRMSVEEWNATIDLSEHLSDHDTISN